MDFSSALTQSFTMPDSPGGVVGQYIGSVLSDWMKEPTSAPVDDSGNSDLTYSDGDYSTPYDFFEYLEGLLASVGAENEVNREYNEQMAANQRKWASLENEKNRAWQTEMSNSAYTRAVADLKNAGLNPILAFRSGGAASTPTGSVTAGSSASYQTGGGDTMSSIITSISSFINSLANSADALSSLLPVVGKLGKGKIGFR